MTLLLQDVPMPQTPHPPIPPIPEIVFQDQSFWSGLPPFLAVVVALAVIAAGVAVLWPIVRALARAIDARTDRHLIPPRELETLQARVAELEALQPRIAELEERLDFTERMLTRGPASPTLRQGDS
jgi:Tfp pilus assembly protein PilO